jgi:hypothetical protein
MARYQLPTRLPEPFSGIFKVMGFGSGATGGKATDFNSGLRYGSESRTVLTLTIELGGRRVIPRNNCD